MPSPSRPLSLRALVLAACTAAVLPVLAVPTTATAEEPPASADTVVGELVRAWPEHEDPADARAHADEGPLAWIETAPGEAVRVPAEDVEEIPLGATVEVTVGKPVADAAEEDGLEPARQVLAAEVVAEAPPEPATAPATQPYTNTVTVVPVQVPGSTPDGTTPEEVAAAVDGPVSAFWEEQSGGSIRLGVTATHPWTSSSVGCSDPSGLFADVARQVGFQAGPGRHLLLYLPGTAQNLPGCSYGLAQVRTGPGDGGYLYVRATRTSVLAHEFGHNFGLGHSSLLQCDAAVDSGTCASVPYYDFYDVMGVSWQQVGSLNVVQAARIGLVPAEQRRTVSWPGSAVTVTLSPVSGRTGTRAVQLTGPDGVVHWLEYRPASGRDAWLATPGLTPALQPGVLVRRQVSDPSDSSVLLDATPSVRAGWAADLQEALPVGRVVTLTTGNFVVQVDSVTDTAATVRIVPGTPISEAYLASGGATGPLGHPTAAETCGARDGGCLRTFQYGAIYWSPATGARLVRQAVHKRWADQGWEWGPLGYPVTDTVCNLRDGGCYQHFQGGSIFSSLDSGSRVVTGVLRERWAATGWERGALGYPVAEQVCGARDGGCLQRFQHGVVYWSPATGAHASLGAVYRRWADQGWEWGGLGYPVTDTVCGLVSGGCFQHFQGGSVFWTSATGARMVGGVVRDRWAAAGWERGSLGYPVAEEQCGARDGGCLQQFQRGAVYRTAATGAHAVSGVVWQRWADQGWEWGPLGYPVTGTTCGLVSGGCSQHFQGGSVFSSPATGARVVDGAVRDRWAAAGWEYGLLGYPVTEEQCGARNGGCLQEFQRGVVYWSPATGAHFTLGAIRQAWAAQGWEWGRLGYPVGDTTCGLTAGGCFQHFQGGSVFFSPATGARQVRGGIRDRWAAQGWERGPLGYPAADPVCGDRGCSQRFQGGTLTAAS